MLKKLDFSHLQEKVMLVSVKIIGIYLNMSCGHYLN